MAFIGGRALRRSGGRSANTAKLGQGHRAPLRAESKRIATALLLAETLNKVIAGIQHLDIAAPIQHQAALRREISVAHIVLRAGRRRVTELGGPPIPAGGGEAGKARLPRAAGMLRLRSGRAGGREHSARLRRIGKERGEVAAKRIDLGLEAVIEHIADHRHAAAKPLPRTAQFRMVELRHAALAPRDRIHHDLNGRDADIITLGKRL